MGYQLTPDPASQSLVVSIHLPHPNATEEFQIPGWSPGYYTMEAYERNVKSVAAHDTLGRQLEVVNSGPRTWTVHGEPGSPIDFTYRITGNDVGLGFFGAVVNSTQAYVNGASTFMYPVGRKTEPTTLSLHLPSGWRLATAMNPGADGTLTAGNYDEMIDEPIQMGSFEQRTFEVEKTPFKVVFVAPPGESISPALIRSDLEVLPKISRTEIQLFHGAPFKRYTFFFHLNGVGFQGGLEHRSSTVIAIPNADGNDISDLCAHELFHAWNVKQIRPSVLGPFDYTSPQRTGNLWFAEGVTDYYSKILTYRSGVHDLQWLMDELQDQVETYQRGRTRLTSTVEDASRAVWEHGGFSLGDLDYYNKGLLAGLLFDARIREVTDGKKSLDDVMRLMYQRYRLPNPGYSEDGILAAINEVAGENLTPFYDRIIRSTAELPYSALSGLGLKVMAPGETAMVPVTEGEDSGDVDARVPKEPKGETFVRFLNHPKPRTGLQQIANAAGGTSIREVGLSPKKFTTWQVLLDSSPTEKESERFAWWTAPESQ